jgi:Ca2+-binding RTX toxin-like protein
MQSKKAKIRSTVWRFALLAPLLGGAIVVPASAASAQETDTCLGVPATIVGHELTNSETGTPGRDVITLKEGNDGFFDIGGDDIVCLDEDFDFVGFSSPPTGNDTISGGPDGDQIFADDGDDTVMGDEGDDQLSGGAGNDTLDGGAGVDDLDGGDGFDVCVGGENVVNCEQTS